MEIFLWKEHSAWKIQSSPTILKFKNITRCMSLLWSLPRCLGDYPRLWFMSVFSSRKCSSVIYLRCLPHNLCSLCYSLAELPVSESWVVYLFTPEFHVFINLICVLQNFFLLMLQGTHLSLSSDCLLSFMSSLEDCRVCTDSGFDCKECVW